MCEPSFLGSSTTTANFFLARRSSPRSVCYAKLFILRRPFVVNEFMSASAGEKSGLLVKAALDAFHYRVAEAR